jgi:hypothetical protein
MEVGGRPPVTLTVAGLNEQTGDKITVGETEAQERVTWCPE